MIFLKLFCVYIIIPRLVFFVTTFRNIEHIKSPVISTLIFVNSNNFKSAISPFTVTVLCVSKCEFEITGTFWN